MAIKFPQEVNNFAIERLLSQHYFLPTKKTGASHPLHIFGMAAVRWIDPFALSLVALWIQALIARGCKVKLELPGPTSDETARPILRFLTATRFSTLLRELEVDIVGGDSGIPARGMEHPISPIIPLDDEQRFALFHKSLEKQEQYEAYFGGISETAIVRSGEIRDVILRELGDNVFEHAKGYPAHLLMTRYRRANFYGNARDEISRRIRRSLPIEENFFRRLANSGYLVVIISDGGRGIGNKLKNVFRADATAKHWEGLRPEHNILDYSFRAYSTSRSEDERLGKLANALATLDIEDAIPATGLYAVRETVRSHRGLISIRSGKSTILFDYLTYPHTGHPPEGLLTDIGLRIPRGPAILRGTQIRVLFPTDLSLVESDHPVVSAGWRRGGHHPTGVVAGEKDVCSFIPLSPTDSEAGGDGSALAKWLLQAANTLSAHMDPERHGITLAVDLSGWDLSFPRASKGLFILLAYLMKLQRQGAKVVLYDPLYTAHKVTPQITELVSRSFDRHGVSKYRALLAVDGSGAASIVGSASDSLHLTSVITGQELDNWDDVVLRNLDHLLNCQRTPAGVHVDLTVSIDEVIGVILEGLRAYVIGVLLEPPIYSSSVCLLRDGSFVEGFFEIQSISDNEHGFAALVQWMTLSARDAVPDYVISLNESAHVVGEAVANACRVPHTNIRFPEDLTSLYRLSLIAAGSRLLIITDVVGSGLSLQRLIGLCSSHIVAALFVVVDARPSNSDSAITSVQTEVVTLRHPLTFWREGKPSHVRYEDVLVVDELNHLSSFPKEAALTSGALRLTGLEGSVDALSDANAIHRGHFVSQARHLTFLLNTGRFCDKYDAEIATEILTWISSFAKGRDPRLASTQISHIMFPAQSIGIGSLVTRLIRDLPGAIQREVTNDELSAVTLRIPLSGVPSAILIVDDACDSGDTTRRLIDIASQTGPRTILAYALWFRGEHWTKRSLREIQQYGNASLHVGFLADLPVPTWKATDCPLCIRRRKLLQALESYGDRELLRDRINSEILASEERDIAPVLLTDPREKTVYSADTLSEALLSRMITERARYDALSRVTLSEMARGLNGDPEVLISVLAAEAGASGSLTRWSWRDDKQVTEALLNACDNMMSGQSETSVCRDAVVIAAMLDVKHLIGKVMDVEWLLARSQEEAAVITVELLLSEGIVDMYSLLEKRYREAGGYWREMADVWARPMVREVERRWSTYTNLLRWVDDSGILAIEFANLRHSLESSPSHTGREAIARVWPAIVRRLDDDVLPAIDKLGSRGHGMPPLDFEAIRAGIVREANSLKRLAKLAILPDHVQEDQLLREFALHASNLYGLVVQGGDGSLYDALAGMRCNVHGEAVKARKRVIAELTASNIACEIVDETKAPIVFAPAIVVRAILDAAIENVIEHAFRADSRQPRQCTIHIERSGRTIHISIRDGGVGLPPHVDFRTWQKPGGLVTMREQASQYALEMDVLPRRGDPDAGTLVKATFFYAGDLV